MELRTDIITLFSWDTVITMSASFFDTASYNFTLPKELIAQNPIEPRDHSRLLLHERKTGKRSHFFFYDLPHLLRPGDVLVMNNTRVFPARLLGTKEGSSRRVEVFCLEADLENPLKWNVLLKPGKKLPEGSRIEFPDEIYLSVGGYVGDGIREVFFPDTIDPTDFLQRYGEIPLPPYITENESPPDRYQTVYSDVRKMRSAAAPTAGLHFTDGLLSTLKSVGIEIEFVSLNVGLGTFRPVKSGDIREHAMHHEYCEISRDTAFRINNARAEGRRIIAVGTTTVRTLESFAAENANLRWGTQSTNIFIYPGFPFRITDGILTNFHLPSSTLLMLICAFGGYKQIMDTYNLAVSEKYRFFSFGDSMCII